MNILTVNLLFSTFVFWVAAKIYVFPKLSELGPKAVLLPILFATFVSTPGINVPRSRSHVRWNPSAICLSSSNRRLACRFPCSGRDSGCIPKRTRRSAARMDLQCGRNAGPACRDNTGYNLWCIGIYVPCLLDTRALGSVLAGDPLHCLCCSLEALDGLGAKRAFKDLILPHCDRWWLACASPDRLTQLVVRGARPRPDRLRCRAYGGDYIRSMVGRERSINARRQPQ